MSIRTIDRMRTSTLAMLLTVSVGSIALSTVWVNSASAQAAAPAPGSRVTGTVSAISGNVLTVKDDQGNESKVTVPDSAKVLQLPAGAKSLSAATPIQVTDIAVGDRILAKVADGAASTLVAMKQADVAKAQQNQLQDWKTKGVNGIVKSVDPAAQTITISTGSGATAKTAVIQTSKTTNIRRYAPDSTKFDDAKPATLDQIKPGDQLLAKGNKNDDGTQVTADAIVAGTFHNIAGVVVSVDPASNKVVVNDLATKKPFTVDVTPDSQLHKLPPMMAQGIARRLNGGAGGGGAGANGGSSAGAEAASGSAASSGSAGGQGGQGAGGAGQRGGDLQQALSRAPAFALADLKKGDAVMALTTQGQTPGEATAITLLAGVEPLLQASPSASQGLLSSSWSLGGGASAGSGQDSQ
jgi:transcription antitermination factor NusG